MTAPQIQVRQATIADLDVIASLFDAYRQFYRYPSDLAGALRFLGDHFEQNQSVIFAAFSDAGAIGFTQLYPSFSSGAMCRIFILNDLFVTPDARRGGAGSALLAHAADYARRAGVLRLVLQTEIGNVTAQSLYESLGWKQDRDFYSYQLSLS